MKPSDRDLARILYQRLMRWILLVIAVIYLAAIWIDCWPGQLERKLLGGTLTYFAQVAGLFGSAAQASIDYRAEGWSCKDARWFELDTSADFPMDADNKENRFGRLMHFHREDRETMQALERFLISRHNRRALDAAGAGDRSPPPLIGGIRTLSLRIPLGRPGEAGERYMKRPIEAYPEEIRKRWYHTPESRLKEQCKKLAP